MSGNIFNKEHKVFSQVHSREDAKSKSRRESTGSNSSLRRNTLDDPAFSHQYNKSMGSTFGSSQILRQAPQRTGSWAFGTDITNMPSHAGYNSHKSFVNKAPVHGIPHPSFSSKYQGFPKSTKNWIPSAGMGSNPVTNHSFHGQTSSLGGPSSKLKMHSTRGALMKKEKSLKTRVQSGSRWRPVQDGTASATDRSWRASLASNSGSSKRTNGDSKTRASLFYRPIVPSQMEKQGEEDFISETISKTFIWSRQETSITSSIMDVDEEEKKSISQLDSPNTRIRNFKLWMEETQHMMNIIDKKNLSDPHLCSEYISDIHSNMKRTELTLLPKPNYMRNH